MAEGALDLTAHTARDGLKASLNQILNDRRTYTFQQAVGACLACLALEADALTILEGLRRCDRHGHPLPWPGWLPERRGRV